MDYSWIDGIEAPCKCGQTGTWRWRAGRGVVVGHTEPGIGRECLIVQLSPRKERELRLAKTKTGRASERGRLPGGYRRS